MLIQDVATIVTSWVSKNQDQLYFSDPLVHETPWGGQQGVCMFDVIVHQLFFHEY